LRQPDIPVAKARRNLIDETAEYYVMTG